MLVTLVIASSAALAAAENRLSPPVGFVRIEVSSNSQVLASSPFHALEPGAVPGTLGVRVWDAATGYTTLTQASPAVGQGFWLVNNAATQAVVLLVGEVPLDAETGVPLAPGLNLIGPPYPSPVGVEATSLASAALSTADGAAVSTLRPGEGYWYQHAGDQPVVWMEARPYANPFPTNGLPPQIVGLQVVESGRAVRLTIVPGRQNRGPLDIYYQDLEPAAPFDPVGGWLPVGTSVEVVSGSGVCEWVDHGGEGRHPPTAVLGRLYLAACPGVDLDEALHTPLADVGSDGPLNPSDVLDAPGSVDATPAIDDRGRAKPAVRFVSPQGSHQAPFTSWQTAATDVQAAIDVAASGDTVLLAAGEYRVAEALRLDKPLTVRGSEGPAASVIVAVATNPCLRISVVGSVVESLTLTGGVASEGAGLHTVPPLDHIPLYRCRHQLPGDDRLGGPPALGRPQRVERDRIR